MRGALLVSCFARAERAGRLRDTHPARELALELIAHRRRQGRASHRDAERIAQEGELEQEQLPGATLVAAIPAMIDGRGDDPIPRTRLLRISAMSTGRDGGGDERGG